MKPKDKLWVHSSKCHRPNLVYILGLTFAFYSCEIHEVMQVLGLNFICETGVTWKITSCP